MNFLIDVLIVAVAALCCVWGYKSGFVKMLVNFLKNFIAIVVASVFATTLGKYFYKWIFKDLAEEFTANKIAKWLGVDSDSQLDIGKLIEETHTEFLKFIEHLGFDIDTVAEKYGEASTEASDLMVEYIAKPIGTTISNVLAFILLFVVTVLAVKLIGQIIDRFAKLPVLNVTNKLLGLLVGALLGIVFAFIIAALINSLVPYIKISDDYIKVGAIEEGTVIYKYLVNETPGGFIEMLLEKIGVKQ